MRFLGGRGGSKENDKLGGKRTLRTTFRIVQEDDQPASKTENGRDWWAKGRGGTPRRGMSHVPKAVRNKIRQILNAHKSTTRTVMLAQALLEGVRLLARRKCSSGDCLCYASCNSMTPSAPPCPQRRACVCRAFSEHR